MNYTYKSIIELGKVITGKTPSTEHSEYYSGSYPFITPTDIHTFYEKYLDCTERTLSDLGSQQVRSNLLPKDSICFVCIGSTIGKMCKTKCESFTNQQINSLIPYNEYDSDYVFYYLRYIKDYFISIGGGTGSGKGIVNKTVFSKTKINIVNDKNIQKQISSVLSKYDELIELNNKRIKLLEQTAEELYKEWFVRFRFPNYQNTEFEAGIPKKWQVTKVKNVINRHGFGELYKADSVEKEGNVIVIDQSQDEFVGFHNNEPSHIATIDEPIGLFGDHSCKFQLMIVPFSLSENVIPFTGKNGVNTTYLYYAIKGLIETTEYKRHWSELVSKKIFIPPIDLQNEFEGIMKSNLLMKQSLTMQNRNLIKQRDLLLPRLMSGKLEVK